MVKFFIADIYIHMLLNINTLNSMLRSFFESLPHIRWTLNDDMLIFWLVYYLIMTQYTIVDVKTYLLNDLWEEG